MLDIDRIRDLMMDNLDDFTTQTGVGRSTYYRMLSSKTTSIETLVKLAGYLEVSIDSLIKKDSI